MTGSRDELMRLKWGHLEMHVMFIGMKGCKLDDFIKSEHYSPESRAIVYDSSCG